jgi:hypothetical protein
MMTKDISDEQFLFDMARSLMKGESTIINDKKFTKGIDLILDSIEVMEL